MDSITKDVVNLTMDKAVKVAMDSWDQAVTTRALEFKIIVGYGKRGVVLKRKIQGASKLNKSNQSSRN